MKYRNELKYLCSNGELAILKARLSSVLKEDPHVDINGWYHIRSIYFDDLYNSSMQENEDGVSPREKWRIRAYNRSNERISLECKRKENGMILKQSCLISKDQYVSLMNCNTHNISQNNHPLLNRFLLLQRERLLQPKIIVSYDRKPYICKEGNVRITFDCNISSSKDFDCFFDAALKKRPILLTGRQLLEVKYDEYLPDYIYHAIQMTNMSQLTFSKYYLCRKYSL